MSNHPLNMVLRFLLEMGALVIFAVWGRSSFAAPWHIVAAIGLPVFFATLWGMFAVKGDPSRSGKTVVPTPGWMRLLLELLFFGLAALALYNMDFNITGLAFSFLVLLHYGFSYRRVVWLLKQ